LAIINENKLVNLVEFGRINWWSGEKPNEIESHLIKPIKDEEGNFYWVPVKESKTDKLHIGVEWDEPRDVHKITVTYNDKKYTPEPDSIRVEYWQNSWPSPAPERRKGARRGWIEKDDPWHGRWITANTEVEVNKNQHVYSFEHLDITELPDEKKLLEAEDYNAFFRRTLKIRLVFENNFCPKITGLKIYSKSTWREISVDILFGCREKEGEDWSGSIEVWNGKIRSIEPLNFDKDDAVKENTWKCITKGKSKGIRAKLMYADCSPYSQDRTIVTMRTKARSFSFLINDVLKEPILIKDYNVFIKKANEKISYQEYLSKLSSLNKKSIYDKIFFEPEQSYERASQEIPPLQKTKQSPYGRYIILGCDGNRQEFALRFNGNLFANKKLLKVQGHDTAKLLWPGMELHYNFGTGDPPDFREREEGSLQRLKDGYLPIVETSWLDREIKYKQEAFASLLNESMRDSFSKRGDEDTVCFMQFTMRNTTKGKKHAQIWLFIKPQEELFIDKHGFILALGRIVPGETVKNKWSVQRYEKPLIRGYFNIQGRGRLIRQTYLAKMRNPGNVLWSTGFYAENLEMEGAHNIFNAILYDIELNDYERHTINLTIPFVTLNSKDKSLLSSLNYKEKLNETISYWENYVKEGAKVIVPDNIINDFYKAVPIHVAITADKDPASGLYEVPAATYAYGPCGNEASLQIRQLDYRGYHKRAEKYLETFIKTQGMKPLDGNFKSKDGAFQGVGIYGDKIYGGFTYNLDHGFILRQLAEHYLLTKDKKWLKKVLPNLIRGCDFIIRERTSTMRKDTSGKKCLEYGLLPAGILEDNEEWGYWFAVNAHAYYGMKLTSDILTEINHPEAERISKETKAYYKDIRESVKRAMIESPVVKLLDGTYIPHIPTRAGLRGRELGWFREGAYGPLHLVECGVIKAYEEMVIWILKDLEDNIFVSREFGRAVDIEKYWFSHGGVAIQANLLNNALVYLKRSEFEHAIRCFYNSLGASLYPDVRVFTEHPVIELGHGVGPFYKTPDECGFLNWLRMFLVYEEGKKLFLAMGTPRKWLKDGETITVEKIATYFGNISYKIFSRVSSGEIEAVLNPPKRNVPEEVIISFRHPEREPIRKVMINGVKHLDYDIDRETVRLSMLSDKMRILVKY